MSWGYNGEGQLGDSTHTNKTAPVQVNGLTGVIAIASGGAHTLALKNDGTVWAWGYNVYSSLGIGTPGGDREAPIQVAAISGVVAIAAGGYHSLALKSDGTVWSWGSNFAGEIGDGTISVRATPVQVTGISGIIAISAGSIHSMALKSDGTLYAWGLNSDGRLGDGTTTNRFSPVVVSISNVTKIAAGGWHSLAVKSDGTVWAWGKNADGELGIGSTADQHTPMQITGLSGVSVLKAGEFHSMALKTDGTVWAWGKNASGQLGDGTTTMSTSPVQVSGISGVNTIACGTEHSLALKNDGTLWGWGANSSSQLSDGTTANQTTAVQTMGLCTALVAGIKDQPESGFDFSIYPNPSAGKVIMELPVLKSSTIHVINITGQEVYTEATNGGITELNLEQFPAGMYIIRFSSAESSGAKRLIIQK